MIIKNFVQKEQYYDSVFLMRMAAEVGKADGVEQATAGMGTPLNKGTMEELGVLAEEGRNAGVNDMVLAMAAQSEEQANAAYELFVRLIEERQSVFSTSYSSIDAACANIKDLNLAVITVAGKYAAAEGMAALRNGLNVFMFSDNVDVEDEVELKKLAEKKGLLMMGPSCGLSFIDGVAIGLCSKARRGNIGIVGASGSGIQEVMALVHRAGKGVSQAIGTGGRDLKDAVGGITMLQGIKFLEEDEDTKVIVLISKPPEKATMEKVLEAVKNCTKPVVVQFINGDQEVIRKSGAYAGTTFTETAYAAVDLADGKEPSGVCTQVDEKKAAQIAASLGADQKYLRGIFCGGALAEEALTLAQNGLGKVYSNVAFTEDSMLDDPFESRENTIIDIGEEDFTKGRPHVAIDPTVRVSRFVKEARDPETAVILLDFLLGYALHEDPAGVLAPTIAAERAAAAKEGRSLNVVAYICGTDLDPQIFCEQKKKLEDAGVFVADSNESAARFAVEIIRAK